MDGLDLCRVDLFTSLTDEKALKFSRCDTKGAFWGIKPQLVGHKVGKEGDTVYLYWVQWAEKRVEMC